MSHGILPENLHDFLNVARVDEVHRDVEDLAPDVEVR
jgi:hypothetical protein